RAEMIHLDTSFLIHGLVPGSPEDHALRKWLEDGESLGTSTVAWTEFSCGPLAEGQRELASRGGNAGFRRWSPDQTEQPVDLGPLPRADLSGTAGPSVAQSPHGRASQHSRHAGSAGAAGDPFAHTSLNEPCYRRHAGRCHRRAAARPGEAGSDPGTPAPSILEGRVRRQPRGRVDRRAAGGERERFRVTDVEPDPVVLDASALLAMLQSEPGSEAVGSLMD